MEGTGTHHRFLRFGLFVALLAMLVGYYYLRFFPTVGLWPYGKSDENLASTIFSVGIGVLLASVYSAFHLFGKETTLVEKK